MIEQSKTKIIYSIYIIGLIVFYFSGFYLSEDSLGGAYTDFQHYHLPAVKHFSELPFNEAIRDYSSASMPLYYILNAYFNPFLDHQTFFILSHIIVAFLTGYLFFKVLTKRYPEMSIKNLILLNSIIFISPSYKSVALSPTSDGLPYLFLLLGILLYYFYEEDEKNTKFIPIVLFFLILASLTRQYYILLFGFFTFIFMVDNIKNIKQTILILFYSIFLFIPFAYIIYIWGGLVPPSFQHHSSFNLNSIPYIFAFIGLYSIPYLITIFIRIFENKPLDFTKREMLQFVFIAILYLLFFMDFYLYERGGGIIAKVSLLISSVSGLKIANYFFLLFSLSGLFFMFYILKKSWINLIPFVAIFFFITTEIIFNKYADPLMPIILLLLVNYGKDTSIFFRNNRFIILLFLFHFFLYLISFTYYNVLQ